MNPVQEIILLAAQTNMEAARLPVEVVANVAMGTITDHDVLVKAAEAFTVAVEYLFDCMTQEDARATSLIRGLLDIVQTKTADEVIEMMVHCLPPKKDRPEEPIEERRRSVKAPRQPRGKHRKYFHA